MNLNKQRGKHNKLNNKPCKFSDWQNRNYAKFVRYQKYIWLALFIVNVFVIGYLTVFSVWNYFALPDTPLSVTLPTNVWFIFIFTPIGREFLFGIFTCWLWYSYRNAPSVHAQAHKEAIT